MDDPAQNSTPPVAHVPSKIVPDITDLIWEDEPVESQAWWLTRSRSGDLQVFIAPDPITGSLLGLCRTGARPQNYDVVMALVEQPYPSRPEALIAAKHAMAIKISDPLAEVGRPLMVWRLSRALKFALNQVPLAAVALLIGALLGLAVALFAISTSLVGWPMLVAGILIGAASGPLLKFLVERRFKSLLGPWGRFWVATLAAALGAFAAAGGLLTLFWA
jgi:hypothetical protein